MLIQNGIDTLLDVSIDLFDILFSAILQYFSSSTIIQVHHFLIVFELLPSIALRIGLLTLRRKYFGFPLFGAKASIRVLKRRWAISELVASAVIAYMAWPGAFLWSVSAWLEPMPVPSMLVKDLLAAKQRLQIPQSYDRPCAGESRICWSRASSLPNERLQIPHHVMATQIE